jgi:hypothetical protein
MCQDSNARQIKAGISKKSGKPYDAFIACDACGFKGQSENGTVNKVVEVISKNEPKKPNGIEPSMRQSYRKDLMVAVLETYGNGGTAPVSDVIAVATDLWGWVEK